MSASAHHPPWGRASDTDPGGTGTRQLQGAWARKRVFNTLTPGLYRHDVVSGTAPLVFASLGCLQISPYHRHNLYCAVKSLILSTRERHNSWHLPQYTFNKQSSEHNNCLVQLICNTCVICIESACQPAALS